ncbi:ejaculatory bulb-specific protein 3-like [Aricia agestis]|uniref:ejaculatory bulb-specific protein 3-like n=1 Tax=Aricia agestis TaxID=91739 RepID=UPI001C207A69|nr:ejaculatory bulb-specific protein 3-like [Aricia agestis]
MKWIILSMCVVACTADFYAIPKDDHTVDALRRDLPELKRRLACYIDEGPCSPMAEAYKNIAEDMVLTKCAKCSPELLELCRAFLEASREAFPREYSLLRMKYDPTDSYFDALENTVGCSRH